MAPTLEFRVLGPLEVLGGAKKTIVAGKQRILLAALLLHPNSVVTADKLIDYLWAQQCPEDPRAALQIHVARLRRSLKSGDASGPEIIQAQNGGYLIDVTAAQLDLQSLQELCSQIARAEQDGDSAAELRLLNKALGLWRGAPLSDIGSDALQMDEVPQLTERWLAFLERRFELELLAGNHAGIIADLSASTKAHPFREKLWEQLMLALYQGGRRAEALQSYRTVTEILRDELGIDPGERLTGLHQKILHTELAAGSTPAGAQVCLPGPDEEPPSTAGRPVTDDPLAENWHYLCQLPGNVMNFVGRGELMKEIADAVTADRRTVPVVTLTGPPGVGKSALAIRAAHQLSDHFPDGQLYARMSGTREGRRDPGSVLAEFLQTFGVPAMLIPEGTEAKAALFRARISGRRVLLVLDDILGADQVMPLLPGSSGSGAIVTSRNRLPDLIVLHGAKPLMVGVLTPQEASGLLTLLLGERRTAAEPEAVRDLARLCGGLPLALRIAAANLTFRSSQQIRAYYEELKTGNTMQRLAVGGQEKISVKAALQASYTTLTPRARRLFRLLGKMPVSDFSDEAALAVAGGSELEKELEELVSAHLVEPHTTGRFRFHNLVRLYAVDRARAEGEEGESVAAVVRLTSWYLEMGRSALREIRPDHAQVPVGDLAGQTAGLIFHSASSARRWFADERFNLAMITKYMTSHGFQGIGDLFADLMGMLRAESVLVTDG